MNELKRYIKYNSDKLGYLKLRNKFFDRLRNRGFRKYLLSKIFASVSYSSRNKYLLTSDKCYSTVIQETEAEAALIEVGEEMFNDHLINSTRELSKKKEDLGALFRDGDISPTDKVVHSEYSLVPKNANNKPTKDFSLGLIFPGECFELKKDIQNIFKEEFTKSCNSSKSFKDCFATSTIGALFKNEKKMGAIISKSKL